MTANPHKRISPQTDRYPERLRAQSEIIETALGPVETAICGHGPAVVVLHGALGGFDRAMVYSFPEDGFRFICPSRPGYLRTPLENGKTPAQQADLLAALLDELGVKQAAVIGCSAGGPVAVQFAVRHPERCWALVMGNAVTAPLRGPHLLIEPIAKLLFGWDWLTWFGVNRGVLYLLRPNLGIKTIGSPEKQAQVIAMLRSMYPTSFRKAGFLNDFYQFQHNPDYPLDQVEVPTMVVHGTADMVVPYRQGKTSAKHIPGNQFLSIPGGTHLCFISHREIVRPALASFLQEHQPKN